MSTNAASPSNTSKTSEFSFYHVLHLAFSVTNIKNLIPLSLEVGKVLSLGNTLLQNRSYLQSIGIGWQRILDPTRIRRTWSLLADLDPIFLDPSSSKSDPDPSLMRICGRLLFKTKNLIHINALCSIWLLSTCLPPSSLFWVLPW